LVGMDFFTAEVLTLKGYQAFRMCKLLKKQ